MIKYNKNLWGSIAFLILSLTIWILIPYQIVLQKERIINSQTFPRIVVGLMIICSTYLFIKSILDIVLKKEIDYGVIVFKEEFKSILMIFSVILFWVTLHFIHFMIAACIFSCLVMLIFKCKKLKYYLITIAFVIIITFMFQQLLGVNLP